MQNYSLKNAFKNITGELCSYPSDLKALIIWSTILKQYAQG